MADITNPHDRFFREMFGQADIAADFVANYLPASVVAQLDMTTFAAQPDSFIDSDLHALHSDLLLRVSLHDGGQAWVYILVEHKSFVERQVTVQLLRYLVRIWERDARDGDVTPRPVIPIVLYHGRRRWSAPTRLSELFEGPDELRAYWPELQVLVIDLTAHDESDIVGEVRLRVAMLLMRAIFSHDLIDRLPRILALLRQLAGRATLLDVLRTVLSYIAQSNASVTTEQLRGAVDVALSEPGGESMTTLVEEWLEQGRKEGLATGIERGRTEGIRESIRLALSQRSDVPSSEVAALASDLEAVEDSESLRVILRTILAGRSIDDARRIIG